MGDDASKTLPAGDAVQGRHPAGDAVQGLHPAGDALRGRIRLPIVPSRVMLFSALDD